MKLLFLFFSFAFVNAFAEQRIEILSSISVKPGSVYLKDIAIIEGFGATSQQELENLEIERNINIGEQRKYSDSALTDILRRKLNQIKQWESQDSKEFNLVLKMPKLLEIYVSGPLWTKTQIENKIVEDNKKLCGECEFKITNLILPEVSVKKIAKWQMDSIDRITNGSFQIPIKVYSLDKKDANTYYINGRMKVMRKLPIARRNMNAKDRITKEDIVWEDREWNFTRRDIPSETELIGAKLKRTSLSGSILWLSNLEKTLAVQQGDLVDLVVRRDTWQIRMKAIAQGPGVIGDNVNVKSRETQKLISAKIIGNGEVELR